MAQFITKQDLYEFIASAKERYGIKNCSYPLNLIGICEDRNNLDIEYLHLKTKGLCGVAFIGNKSDTIVLNSGRTEKERNYDCAHEVIHLLKHRNLGIAEFKCYENRSTSIEWQANEGAAETLVPYKLLLPLICENRGLLKHWKTTYALRGQLATYFNVTESVIKYRLENLKYEISQYLNGTKLENLEILSAGKQKQANINIKSINTVALIQCLEEHFDSIGLTEAELLEEAGYDY